MPRIGASSIKRPAGEFTVTPWQRKRQAAPRNDTDLYAEIVVPVGSSASAAEGNIRGPTAEHEGAGLEVALAAETSDASIPSASFQDHGNNEAPNFSGQVDFDAALDGHTDRALEQEAQVPSITGTATVALLASPPEGFEGHVKDGVGDLLLTFKTQMMLQRQECTRDDDWSLHLLTAKQPRCTGRLQILVEVTGDHAVRLRAPPSAHGQEAEAATVLQRCGGKTHQEASLSFDCEQLHSGEMAREVVRSEGLRVFQKVKAVAVGQLCMQPCQGDV